MNIEEKIAKAHYVASEQDIEQLARAHLAGEEQARRTDGTYLRVLVSVMQAQFGNPRKGRPAALSGPERETHAAFLADKHAAFYVAVLRGVSNGDAADTTGLSPEERRKRVALRNSRASFARSSASTLQAFIKAGGDVRRLTVDEVTKASLRAFVKAQAGEEDPTAATVEPALARVEKKLVALLESDPDVGKEAVEACIERLQRLLLLATADVPHGRTLTEIETGILPRGKPPPGRAAARRMPS